MKTITAVFLAFVFIVNAQAQDQLKKGVYSLSGSLSYSSSSSSSIGNENDEQDITLLPRASLFVFDRVEGSLGLGYSYYIVKSSYESVEYRRTALLLSLGVRYYFLSGKIAPFVGADGGMYWTSSEGRTYSKPVSNYGLIGGIEIFISQAAAIEPALVYSRYSDEFASGSEFSISLGVKYFIL